MQLLLLMLLLLLVDAKVVVFEVLLVCRENSRPRRINASKRVAMIKMAMIMGMSIVTREDGIIS